MKPQFWNNILSGEYAFHSYILIFIETHTRKEGLIRIGKEQFRDKFISEDSGDSDSDDRAIEFLWAIIDANKECMLIQRWKESENCFSVIEASAKRFSTIKATLNASQSFSCTSGNLTSADCICLLGENIRACTCVRTWERLL